MAASPLMALAAEAKRFRDITLLDYSKEPDRAAIIKIIQEDDKEWQLIGVDSNLPSMSLEMTQKILSHTYHELSGQMKALQRTFNDKIQPLFDTFVQDHTLGHYTLRKALEINQFEEKSESSGSIVLELQLPGPEFDKEVFAQLECQLERHMTASEWFFFKQHLSNALATYLTAGQWSYLWVSWKYKPTISLWKLNTFCIKFEKNTLVLFKIGYSHITSHFKVITHKPSLKPRKLFGLFPK